MSTIRVKRKHVLDSDSETDDDEAAPGEKTNSPIATTGVVAVAAVVADGSDDDNVANDKPAKRLMSAADRDAKASVEAKANVRDEVDLVGGKGDGDEGERSSPIELHDDSNDDSDSGGDKAHTEDPALVRCAQISRRLRRALGDGVGSSDGPLSPTHGGSSQQSARALGGGAKKNATKKRVLVSAADVASLAGKNSRCDSLKPYQMIGINFLLLLDEQDVPGAILADEMGLGKTAQTIAYLTMSRHRKAHGEGGWHKSVNNSSIGSKGGGNKLLQAMATQKNASKSAHEPALVVAPASLLENWKRELTTWAPTLRVGFYHGAAGQKEVREACDFFSKNSGDGKAASGGGAYDVLIACYSLFERDSADQRNHRAWLRQLTFSHLVLDEAHLVKNRSTQRAKRLDVVAARARRRVLLTGTPLQNNLLELEALIHLVLPGLLAEGALGGGDGGDGGDGVNGETGDGGDERDENGVTASDRRAARVKTILKPFILRRLKEEVAKELEVKKQVVLVEEMVTSQACLYKHTLQLAREERARKTAPSCNRSISSDDIIDVSGDKDDDDTGAKEPQAQKKSEKTKQLFVKLRKIANHPLLVRDKFSDKDVEEIAGICHKAGVFGYEATIDRVRGHLFDEGYSDFDLHKLCGDPNLRGQLSHKRLADDAVLESGKTKKLLSLLEELKKKGSRPLIFSQWKIVLDILEVALQSAGHKYVRLDGGTPTETRQTICDDYNDPNSDLFAFLLSTRAGGQGLNLTSADTVVIHDCDFNPQIDRQAEDRCHRLGQTKPVTVIRLVTGDSVDQRIVDIATRKLDLDAQILSDPKALAAAENRAMHEIMEDLLG